jgi:hypothetical protein
VFVVPELNRKPRRSENRFRERELARAVRAANAGGAERIELDPASGIITVILPGKSGEAASGKNPWDEVLNNAADDKRTS